MYKLTENRLRAAHAILEKYRDALYETQGIRCMDFEHELRDCWGVGYQSLKDIIIDLSKLDRYEHLAAYYMQFQNPTGVVSEFQGRLAEIYGSRHATDADAYWERAIGRSARRTVLTARRTDRAV